MLLNKDGTPYKLNSPNPIMTQQNLWTKDKLTIHNRFGKIVVYSKSLVPLYKQQDEEIRPVEIPSERPARILPEPKKLDTSEIKADIDDIEKNKIHIWCLPAFLEERVDELYGERYKKIRYGDKFLFEGIMKSQTDFTLSIITSTPEVTEGSILYPKTSDKRWWRVDNINKSGNLYLVNSSLTDYQPRFS